MNKEDVIPFCKNKALMFINKNSRYFSKWNILKETLNSIVEI